MTFSDFNFHPRLVEGLDSMGYEKPTPVQEMTIPVILQNHDLIACAQTGTGKTAAYVLPLLNKIVEEHTRHLNTLVIAPTRELALQIDQQVEGFAYFLGVSSLSVYGGSDGATWDQQRKAMESGADIIIATPGRLIALLATGKVDFSHLKHLVLDEADRMLDMGFFDDIVRIIKELPADRQTLMFSATMPPKIRSLAKAILKDPREINIAISKPASGILQQAYMVHDHQKMALLKNILATNEFKSAIIFANSKENVKKLGSELIRAGLPAKAFHSDLEQSEREQIMNQFKSRKLQMLIGTDILSRGIDVEGIELVLNYDTPHDAEDYVHRIGRTARAEKTGTAITFVNERDHWKFQRVEKLIGNEIQQLPLPAELGPGPDFQAKSAGKKPFSRPRNGQSQRKWRPKSNKR
ncbi:MAG TPA: DEAD/DEAH box helicase [Chryseosolibacter sp.]|nr:DEAD/DEAH box helicase [Chryseosolibacter sp.]